MATQPKQPPKKAPDLSDFIDFSDESLTTLSSVSDADVEVAKAKIKQGGLTLMLTLLDSPMKERKDA